MNFKKSLAVIATLATLFVSNVNAENVSVNTDKNSVTLAGHDAVAYFTENAPVKGSEKYTAVYQDAIYRFSSAKNRDTFNANPSKYAPQYGGFCAFGAKLGQKFEVDGKAFEVLNGKLYVNKNAKVYDLWSSDKVSNISIANKKWEIIKGVPAADLGCCIMGSSR